MKKITDNKIRIQNAEHFQLIIHNPVVLEKKSRAENREETTLNIIYTHQAKIKI